MKKIALKTPLALAALALVLILSFTGAKALAATTTAPPLDYSGLVKCDGVVDKNNPNEKNRQTECNFSELIVTINKLINWAFYLSIPVATVLFAYGGVLYLTGSEGNIKKAKEIFTSVGIGFIIVLVAWFGIYTLVNWFVAPDSGATTLIGTP